MQMAGFGGVLWPPSSPDKKPLLFRGRARFRAGRHVRVRFHERVVAWLRAYLDCPKLAQAQRRKGLQRLLDDRNRRNRQALSPEGVLYLSGLTLYPSVSSIEALERMDKDKSKMFELWQEGEPLSSGAVHQIALSSVLLKALMKRGAFFNQWNHVEHLKETLEGKHPNEPMLTID